MSSSRLLRVGTCTASSPRGYGAFATRESENEGRCPANENPIPSRAWNRARLRYQHTEVYVLCSPLSCTVPFPPVPPLRSNELDKRFGTRGWNCVVGRSFGGYVTQKIKCYAYLSVYPGVNILVWKA
jgi:hypothetical protein